VQGAAAPASVPVAVQPFEAGLELWRDPRDPEAVLSLRLVFGAHVRATIDNSLRAWTTLRDEPACASRGGPGVVDGIARALLEVAAAEMHIQRVADTLARHVYLEVIPADCSDAFAPQRVAWGADAAAFVRGTPEALVVYIRRASVPLTGCVAARFAVYLRAATAMFLTFSSPFRMHLAPEPPLCAPTVRLPVSFVTEAYDRAAAARRAGRVDESTVFIHKARELARCVEPVAETVCPPRLAMVRHECWDFEILLPSLRHHVARTMAQYMSGVAAAAAAKTNTNNACKVL
jgi:hypothetical protein